MATESRVGTPVFDRVVCGVDLVVVGSRGLRGLGSLSERLAHHWVH